jgi:hypothetical protein
MALKILSGVLETNLCPEGLSLARTRMIGSGRYRDIPCKMVALREIQMHVFHEGGPHIRDVIESDSFRISDVSMDEHYMTIKWESTGGSKIVEISYMVIGEVPDR